MSGFDTSRASSGIVFRSKQFGSILRGYGPPVPQAGVTGDLYIDVQTWNLFEKRDVDGIDDWGHYLWVVPSLYRTSLKWFGSSAPLDNVGTSGDYFLQWAGYPNYGMQPSIWGPRSWNGWPENGGAATTTTPILLGHPNVHQIGLVDEGSDLTDVGPNTLIAVGLFDEYVVPGIITANPGDPISQLGLQSSGSLVLVALNNLYTAEDAHDI